MKLSARHREALLNELEAAKEKAAIQKKGVNDTEHSDEMRKFFEVWHFLALQNIETIKAALIHNEIDY